jgi:putative transcriptional regulator
MQKTSKKRYLDGNLLVAMPTMTDPRFERGVIYLCAHSGEGAMGIIVNQRAANITFPELLTQLNVIPESESIRLPRAVQDKRVHLGGPVETSRGFVLHSSDYFAENNTLPIDDFISLTATLEILKAIALDAGPQNSLLALGYAGWAAGQLENEIQDNGWLTCPADPEIVFETDMDRKYERAMEKIGIDPAQLASEAGHA